MAKIRICKTADCSNAATTRGYCRLHYLKHWKEIRAEQKRVAVRRLNRYIEHMCRKHPSDYLEIIRRELRNPEGVKALDEQFSAEEDVLHFEEGTSDEDINELIRKLRVEKGF
jgi:hypothetical protein